jgi:hypothetical protein
VVIVSSSSGVGGKATYTLDEARQRYYDAKAAFDVASHGSYSPRHESTCARGSGNRLHVCAVAQAAKETWPA